MVVLFDFVKGYEVYFKVGGKMFVMFVGVMFMVEFGFMFVEMIC